MSFIAASVAVGTSGDPSSALNLKTFSVKLRQRKEPSFGVGDVAAVEVEAEVVVVVRTC